MISDKVVWLEARISICNRFGLDPTLKATFCLTDINYRLRENTPPHEEANEKRFRFCLTDLTSWTTDGNDTIVQLIAPAEN